MNTIKFGFDSLLLGFAGGWLVGYFWHTKVWPYLRDRVFNKVPKV